MVFTYFWDVIVFAHISGWSGKCGEIVFFFFVVVLSIDFSLLFFDDFDVRGRGITQFV